MCKHDYRSYQLCCRWQFVFYIVNTAVMTLALVLAARKTDPREYDEGIDKFRGVCEVLLSFFVIYNFLEEVYQIIR